MTDPDIGKRKRASDAPASPISSSAPAGKRAKRASREASTVASMPEKDEGHRSGEEERDDETESPAQEPFTRIMSAILEGLRTGQQKLEITKAQEQAVGRKVTGAPVGTGAAAAPPLRPPWYIPFTEAESQAFFYPDHEPGWLEALEGQEATEPASEGQDMRELARKYLVGRYRA